MPDIRRDQYQISHIFHVITRGNSKQILFHTKSDFKAFRTLMQRLSEEYHIEIFCYCLMDNHVHMIIRDEEKRMSLFVRDLCSGFAKVYNTKYNHSGHVFQGRFKSCPINTRAYFLNCFRYILKNPEKVGVSYDEYEWSSWQSFVNRERQINHRMEPRTKAVFWWCYMHSPAPLEASEIIRVMPTDKSIAEIYKRMTSRERLEDSIPTWGDAIVWGDFHRNTEYPVFWD